MKEDERKLLKDKLAQARRELTALGKAIDEGNSYYGMDFYADQARNTIGAICAVTTYLYAREVEKQYPESERDAKPPSAFDPAKQIALV